MDKRKIVETMRKAGRLAANEVLEEYRNGTPFFHIEDGQIVTKSDIAADKRIFESLKLGFENGIIPGFLYSSEERKKIERAGDPALLFLVDPIDQSERVATGDLKCATSCITALKILEESENGYIGEPVASVVNEIERGVEYIAFGNKARIVGKVKGKKLNFDTSLPRKIGGKFIGPNSSKTLGGENYIRGASYRTKRREGLYEFIEAPLQSISSRVRIDNNGGSYFGANVGTGVFSFSMEAKPTKPSEMAGDIFAKAMGAHVTDMFGNPLKKINVMYGEGGLKRTYHSLVSCTPELGKEILEAIDMESLQEIYNYGVV